MRVSVYVTHSRGQFIDAVDGVTGNQGENVVEIEFRIEAVELGRTEQRVDRRGPLAARVRSGKEVILSSQGDHAQSPFCRVVIDLELTVLYGARERTPAPGPWRQVFVAGVERESA